MNWPICVPRLLIISRIARSVGRASRLKNSSTPRAVAPQQNGHGKRRVKPVRQGRRLHGENWNRPRAPGSSSAARRSQTRPGSPTPRSMIVSRLWASMGTRTVARPSPDCRAAKSLCRRVDPPEGPQVPVEALAIRLEDLGRRLAGRVGLGQHAGRLVLRRQPPLGLLPPGDIVEDDDAPLKHAALVAKGSAGNQDPCPVIAAGIGDVELGLVDRLAADRPDQAEDPRPDRGSCGPARKIS